MNSEGAAAGLQPVFPLLGHPPSVGPWGWGALSALRCPLPQAPAPAVPFKGALTCCVQPSHFLFPSVVQAGTAGWAPFAPVSAPPLLTLTLPNWGAGGSEAEKPAPPRSARAWDPEPAPGFPPGPRAQQPPSSAPRLLRRRGAKTACRCPCASPQAPEALAWKRGRRETGPSPLGAQREAWQGLLTPRPSISFLPGDSCITAN